MPGVLNDSQIRCSTQANIQHMLGIMTVRAEKFSDTKRQRIVNQNSHRDATCGN